MIWTDGATDRFEERLCKRMRLIYQNRDWPAFRWNGGDVWHVQTALVWRNLAFVTRFRQLKQREA